MTAQSKGDQRPALLLCLAINAPSVEGSISAPNGTRPLVTNVVIDLGSIRGGGSLTQALRRALGDPSLVVGYALDGFGIFELQRRSARRARNPRTGERLDVPAKVVVKFRPAKALKEHAEQLPDLLGAKRKASRRE